MSYYKKIFSVFGIVAFVIASISIISYRYNSGQTTQQLPDKKVKISHQPLSVALPLFVAKEKGFFKSNNVDIDLVELTTSNLVAESVQTGDADLSQYTTSVAGLNANEKDPNKMMIYTSMGDNLGKQWDGLFVKTSSGITKPSELVGKKIGVFPGSSGTAYIKDFLKSISVDITKVQFVQLPPPNQKQALDSGSVDAFFAYEPLTTILSQSSDYKKIQPTILFQNPDAAVSIGTINKNFIKNYPDLAKRTIKAIDEGILYSRDNPAEAKQILSKYIKLDPKTLENIVILNQYSNSELKPEVLQKYFDYLLELGELKQKVNTADLIYKP
jgi:NitT/TauT family transport system substrate-binding protein